MQPLLCVNNLQAAYGPAQALFNINFKVDSGEVITLLGRNGMGRSTIVKCLFGLLNSKSGSIAFEGKDITGQEPYKIARIGLGLVPEGRQIFSSLTVEENLIATARKTERSQDSENTHWELDNIYGLFPRLEERRNHLGSQLSGGEQQMLAIGRALMTNPKLLVLDEATEGLAPIVRAEIWKALQGLKAQGLALIVVDKNIGALLDLADNHYILEKGSTIWNGSSAELRQSPELIQQYLGV
jgi:branched-chain amino acid transport system ATP-binding protein